MERRRVVTCFLKNRGEILIGRRADHASTYPGKWGAVSGYLETNDPPQTAEREIQEETGLHHPTLLCTGDPFSFVDKATKQAWTVYPFLFETETRDITPNVEFTRVEWVSPTEILRRETVPRLWESYRRVAPTVEQIKTDRDHGSAALSILALEVLRDAAGRTTAENGAFEDVIQIANELLAARPSMAALENRINRVLATTESPRSVDQQAHTAIATALEADETAATEAASALGGTIATLSRSGTVLTALVQASPEVLIAESRPGGEGIDVAEQLADTGFDVTLLPDAAIAQTLATHTVDAAVVGADTILRDGAIVNKTGTRALALAAHRENTPFYTIAASDKVSRSTTPTLEEAPADELYAGPHAVSVSNPRFDVTPADLIAGIFTDRGHLATDEIEPIAAEFDQLAEWHESSP